MNNCIDCRNYCKLLNYCLYYKEENINVDACANHNHQWWDEEHNVIKI